MANVDISSEIAAISSAVYGEEVRGSIKTALQKMVTSLNTAIGDQVIDRATVDTVLASDALSLKYSNYTELTGDNLNAYAGTAGNYWIPYNKAQTILNIPVKQTGRLFVLPGKGSGSNDDGGIQAFVSSQTAGNIGMWIRGWKGQTWTSWKKLSTNDDIAELKEDLNYVEDSVCDVENDLGKTVTSKNLVNLDKAVVGILTSDGTIDITRTDYGSTGFIDVSDHVGETINFVYRNNSGNMSARTVPCLCLYDSKRELISRDTSWAASYTIESNVKYIRYSLGTGTTQYFDKNSPNRTGAFLGSITGVPFEDYAIQYTEIETLNIEIETLKSDLNYIEDELGAASGINLVNLGEAVTGRLTSNGTIDATATTYGTTGFIDVSNYSGKTLCIGMRNGTGVSLRTVPNLCTYNSNKVLISYDTSWPSNIEIESGVCYVRYSLGTSTVAYFDITSPNRTGAFIDSYPSEFEDFEEHLKVPSEVKRVSDELNKFNELYDISFLELIQPDLETGGINNGRLITSETYVRPKDFICITKGDVISVKPIGFTIKYGAIYQYSIPYYDGYVDSVTIPTVTSNNSFAYTFTKSCYIKFRAAKNDADTIVQADLELIKNAISISHHFSNNDFESKAYYPAPLTIDYDALAQQADGKFNICVQTDTHMSMFTAYHNSGVEYKASNFIDLERATMSIEKIDPDLFANLGDIVRGFEFDQDYETRASLEKIIKTYNDNITCDKFYIIGNHDDGNLFYHNTTYNDKKSDVNVLYPNEQFNRITKYGVNNANTKNYSYKDINGVRIISLYQRDQNYGNSVPTAEQFTIGSDQISWLKNTALDTTNPVIVLTHAPLVTSLYANGGTGFDSVLTALNEFVQNGGIVIAVLSGHTHAQGDAKVDGINHIVFKNGYTFFELVSIDLSLRTITCTVVNNGSLNNRSFTY